MCIGWIYFRKYRQRAARKEIHSRINTSSNRGLTILGSYITGLIIPFTFANKYNANLRKRLGIDLAGFEPNFDIIF
nr:P13 family porin [Borreliella sinica]WPM06362.1 P13 family porin [Borreliella sinica]